jgi:hypothetical protein
MTSVNIANPVLFYQNPIDIYKSQSLVDELPSQVYKCRDCNNNLASNNPASQYQRQKLIQNTVRVKSSLYTMNLAGLAGYQKPLTTYQLVEQAGTPYNAPPKVNWNQMSDRAKPANQLVKTASGSTYHGSSTKHSIVRNRPGAMSPGGVGVDIKHNSYDRYLNRLKGKSVLRRGPIPPNYGAPIPFNNAAPIYGGKVVKTAIVNGCDDCQTDISTANERIYGPVLNAIQDKILSVKYTFHIGDFVWAKKHYLSKTLFKAQIINIVNGVYTIKFIDDNTITNNSVNSLLIYFDCNCTETLSIQEEILARQYSVLGNQSQSGLLGSLECNALVLLSQNGIL